MLGHAAQYLSELTKLGELIEEALHGRTHVSRNGAGGDEAGRIGPHDPRDGALVKCSKHAVADVLLRATRLPAASIGAKPISSIGMRSAFRIWAMTRPSELSASNSGHQ